MLSRIKNKIWGASAPILGDYAKEVKLRMQMLEEQLRTVRLDMQKVVEWSNVTGDKFNVMGAKVKDLESWVALQAEKNKKANGKHKVN